MKSKQSASLRASTSQPLNNSVRAERLEAAAPGPSLHDRLVNTAEAASYLALAPSTLAKMRLAGLGPQYRKLGLRAVRYAISDLRRWADANIRSSTSEEH
jgi:predicted DNA-binding transcriptional regulator AlpA